MDKESKPNYHTGGIVLFLFLISMQLTGVLVLLIMIVRILGGL